MIQMSGRGHRKLRLCSRKNYERKKYQHPPALPVQHVPLTDVSVLTTYISVPLDLLCIATIVSTKSSSSWVY